MFSDEGYTTLFRVRGMPVRLHWSFPLGMLMIGGFNFAPGLWLAYFVLVAAHELGHGLLARRYGCVVTSLDVHGFGGLCSYAGYPTEYQNAVIAWGGVLAQGVLFLAIMGVMATLGAPNTEFSADIVRVFTRVNAIIALINLLPLNGLDGGRAWKLPGFWWRHFRHRRVSTPHPDDLAAGFAKKLRTRSPGPFVKEEGVNEARVVRIERGPDGQVRVVAIEDGEDPERFH
jgi:membrane-associated protease RseP (regulator of RpoE activity)